MYTNVYLIVIRITRIEEEHRRRGAWTWYALLERLLPSSPSTGENTRLPSVWGDIENDLSVGFRTRPDIGREHISVKGMQETVDSFNKSPFHKLPS